MTSPWRYRAIPPLLALTLFGSLAALWGAGYRSAYAAILRGFGTDPFPDQPFLDFYAVLAGADCRRRGFEVWLANPCDLLDRPQGYAPLWLDLLPRGVGVEAVFGFGLVIGLLVILGLPLLFRPRSAAEAALFSLASLSTMVVYAVERANIDTVVFLLVVLAGLSQAGRYGARLGAYGLILLAGMLKYYPLVLLVLILRERGWRALLPGGAAVVILGLYGWLEGPALVASLTHMPAFATPLMMDGFSAKSLPFGITGMLGWLPPAYDGLAGSLLLVAIALVAARRALGPAEALVAARLDWSSRELGFLLLGATLLVACFFVSDNFDYRGILFLPVIAGLVALNRRGDPALAGWNRGMIGAVLFLMWGEAIRRGLEGLIWLVLPVTLLDAGIKGLFWLFRELVWWWVMAGLAAIMLAYGWQQVRERRFPAAAPGSAAAAR